MNRYPPFKALLAFDAAMRTQSFSLAAEELHVTAGAIGQQIQKLEEWLGVVLFLRQVRHIVPTEVAHTYWQHIQPALVQIADASQKLKASSSTKIWLSMPPSLATNWFTPKMARLLTQHPEIELHLNISSALVDFEHEAIDLAIRYFEGNDPNLDSTLLFKDEARVYCSPQYAQALQLNTPAELIKTTWLATTMHPDWQNWLEQFGQLTKEQLAIMPRIHFDQALMAIEAAKQSQGVLITSSLLIENELATGTLIEPFPDCYIPMSNGYYLVHHKKLGLRPIALTVKEWLIKETSKSTEHCSD